jgi:hypothetical protein
MHFLYGPGQMPIRKMFLDFMLFQGGPHKNVKSGLYCVYVCVCVYMYLCFDSEYEIFSLNWMKSQRWIQYLRNQRWELADQLEVCLH